MGTKVLVWNGNFIIGILYIKEKIWCSTVAWFSVLNVKLHILINTFKKNCGEEKCKYIAIASPWNASEMQFIPFYRCWKWLKMWKVLKKKVRANQIWFAPNISHTLYTIACEHLCPTSNNGLSFIFLIIWFMRYCYLTGTDQCQLTYQNLWRREP